MRTSAAELTRSLRGRLTLSHARSVLSPDPPIERVRDLATTQPGDVTWLEGGCDLEDFIHAQEAYARGAAGVISSYPLPPGEGRFAIHVPDRTFARRELVRRLWNRAAGKRLVIANGQASARFAEYCRDVLHTCLGEEAYVWEEGESLEQGLLRLPRRVDWLLVPSGALQATSRSPSDRTDWLRTEFLFLGSEEPGVVMPPGSVFHGDERRAMEIDTKRLDAWIALIAPGGCLIEPADRYRPEDWTDAAREAACGVAAWKPLPGHPPHDRITFGETPRSTICLQTEPVPRIRFGGNDCPLEIATDRKCLAGELVALAAACVAIFPDLDLVRMAMHHVLSHFDEAIERKSRAA